MSNHIVINMKTKDGNAYVHDWQNVFQDGEDVSWLCLRTTGDVLPSGSRCRYVDTDVLVTNYCCFRPVFFQCLYMYILITCQIEARVSLYQVKYVPFWNVPTNEEYIQNQLSFRHLKISHYVFDSLLSFLNFLMISKIRLWTKKN